MKIAFNDKLDSFFKSFSLVLGVPPARHLIHLYADYVELVALFSNGDYVSASDIKDRFKDEGIIRQADKSRDQAEENDMDEGLIDQVFRLLNERSILFENDYPFQIYDHDKLRLKPQEQIWPRNKLYISLLLSASLNIFDLFQPELTTEFEEISENVLKNYLPGHAVVKSFGKKSEYKGLAVDKIKSLAVDLGTVTLQEDLDEISQRGNQERGLDLIGWVPFEDAVPNFLSILAQCACGKDWKKKLVESRRYEKYLKFVNQKPIHSLFIPYSLVNQAKSVFFQNDEFSIDTLVFERRRILKYMGDLDFFNFLNSKLLVDRCLDFKEDIV